MGILSAISSVFCPVKTEGEDIKKQEQKTADKNTGNKTDVCSKELAEAQRTRMEADIKIASMSAPESEMKKADSYEALITADPSSRSEVDDLKITQDFLEFKKEAKKVSRTTALKLRNAFMEGDLSDIKDKNGNVVASFEIPEKPYDILNEDDCCSYKMIEYEPDTKDIKAITRVYENYKEPYFERIGFGKTPEENTFLKTKLSRKTTEDGKDKICSFVKMYAEGYRTDGRGYNRKMKADKYYSNILHKGYESYRTNYEAPENLFMGCIYTYDGARSIETGGSDGEKFDSALEYPTAQFKIGNEILVSDPYYVNEKGNRN